MITICIMKFATDKNGKIIPRQELNSEFIEIDCPELEKLIDSEPENEEWEIQYMRTEKENYL